MHVTISFILDRRVHTMNIEDQQQKFYQSLNQLAYHTAQLTNALVFDVVERSPQLYVKTKLHLLSCIGTLSQEVVELQQAWEELSYHRKKAGLRLSEDYSVSLPKEKQSKELTGKRAVHQAPAESPPVKRGRKKAVPSVPAETLEERIQVPAPITTDTT